MFCVVLFKLSYTVLRSANSSSNAMMIYLVLICYFLFKFSLLWAVSVHVSSNSLILSCGCIFKLSYYELWMYLQTLLFWAVDVSSNSLIMSCGCLFKLSYYELWMSLQTLLFWAVDVSSNSLILWSAYSSSLCIVKYSPCYSSNSHHYGSICNTYVQYLTCSYITLFKSSSNSLNYVHAL